MKLLLAALGLVWCALTTHATAQTQEHRASEVLQAVKKRGEIAIGVKTDFPLFGALDESGQVVGFEVDLAQKIADELGVRLKKVVVSNEDRFLKLEQGLIDVTIATAFDTRERRQIATAIEPNYYGAGTTVMLRPDHPARDWADIRGQTVCALQGAHFNRPIAQRYLVKLELYRNARDALLALKEGRCIGYLHSEVSIAQYLRQSDWQGYKAHFTPAILTPWAISVRRSERGTDFERWMGDTVAQWHRTGYLIGLEEQWGIRPSQWLKTTQGLWSRKTPQGDYVCSRTESGEWPLECRNQEFLVAADAAGIQGLGLWLREYLGIDLSIAYDDYDASRFFQGLLYSCLLIACAVLIALVVGAVGFRALVNPKQWSRAMGTALGLYGRLTPPLLQMYLLLFGIGGAIGVALGIQVSAFAVAVWCTGAYAGCQIMFILLEAALALHPGAPINAIAPQHLPQFIRYAITPVKGSLINLTKGTTMASSIAVPELLYATIAIIGDRGNTWVMMTLLLLVFLGINSVWAALVNWMEKLIRSRLSEVVHG